MSKTITYKNRHQVKVKPEAEASSAWESWIKPALILGGVIAFVVLLILVDIGKIRGPLAVIVTVLYIGLMLAEFVMELCPSEDNSSDDDESD